MTGEMQARPMAEVLEAFRRRVVLTGGSEEEHCALYELEHLREVNAELLAALGQLRLEVTHYRETGHGMDHLITAEGEAIRVLLEHHSRAALSKAGSK